MGDLLKLMTCGSVDDGKSTLIGRLMADSGCLRSDEAETLRRESRAVCGDRLDYSLLLDGLEAEREQRITIDVAYRFLRTQRRSFIIADTPGHTEYTRNMAVGASFADLAVILTDAEKGATQQTARHIRICSFMGIRDFVFVINKMDTVGYSRERFDAVRRQIESFTAEHPAGGRYFIPISATEGDNVTEKSARIAWFDGPPLLEYLETVQVGSRAEAGTVIPVQRVSFGEGVRRGYQGCVESGTISEGDTVTVFPSMERAAVRELLSAGRKTASASAGEQITLALDRELDVSRGCVICRDAAPKVCTRFEAKLLWLDDASPRAGYGYLLRIGTAKMPASIVSVDGKLRVEDGRRVSDTDVGKNDLFCATISVSSPVVADSFRQHRSLGGFILIDRLSNATSACGTVTRTLDNRYIFPTDMEVSPAARAAQKGQTPVTLWFTGLPGSGKSTVANGVERRLFGLGRHTMLLDGDHLRSGVNAGLGFSPEDRAENIRVTAEIAKLMNEAGLIALVCLVSPKAADRENARRIVGGRFVEIFVKASAETCEKRDPKGYYRLAKEGKIKNYTGVSAGYEAPDSPELTLDADRLDAETCAEQVLEYLRQRKII